MSARGISWHTYPTPLGPLSVGASDEAVHAVTLGLPPAGALLRPTALSNRCATELQEYLAGKRAVFDLPLALEGSPFQRRVWQAASSIPYGQTRTAAEVAELISEPGAFRAVGAALNRNPLPILIPTHRVTSASGTPRGSGARAALQRHCLELEGCCA